MFGRRKDKSVFNQLNNQKIMRIEFMLDDPQSAYTDAERKMLKTAKNGEDEFELRQGYVTITIHSSSNLYIENKVILNYKNKFRKNFE